MMGLELMLSRAVVICWRFFKRPLWPEVEHEWEEVLVETGSPVRRLQRRPGRVDGSLDQVGGGGAGISAWVPNK